VASWGADDGPIGATVEQHRDERRARSRRYRDAQDRLQRFEEIARVVIMRRAELGLTKQSLANRMGTTKSVISGIESGQHRCGLDTLRRLAEALGGQARAGLELPAESGSPPCFLRL